MLIEVPPDQQAPGLARQAADKHLVANALPDADRRDLLIAVSEAVELAVEFPPRSPGKIALLMRVSDSEIEFQIHSPDPGSFPFAAEVPPELARLLPRQFRLLHGLVDVVTLSLDGDTMFQLTKKRRR